MTASYKKSDADWAVEILREKMEPMYYQDILDEMARRQGIEYSETENMEVYTRLNLDNRMKYCGEGKWYFVGNRTYREDHEEA